MLTSELDSVYSLALSSSNNAIFASGGGDDIAVVWTMDNPEAPVLNTLIGHGDTVDKLAFNFDGKLLATAALDGGIIIWDPITGQKKFNLDGPTEDIAVRLGLGRLSLSLTVYRVA